MPGDQGESTGCSQLHGTPIGFSTTDFTVLESSHNGMEDVLIMTDVRVTSVRG